MKAVLIGASLCALTACSVTGRVEGSVQNSDETFTGTATGYMSRDGTLHISSNKGAVCDGLFTFTAARIGEGVFKCSDGRSGPFRFVSTGARGSGSGSLGKQIFTFTFER
jgi:hypothetical protein